MKNPPVMENWLAGHDLAYDHHNTGDLGLVMCFGLFNQMRMDRYDIGREWRLIAYVYNPSVICEATGWDVV